MAAACEKLCRHGEILASELNREAVSSLVSVGKVREDLSANLQVWLHTHMILDPIYDHTCVAIEIGVMPSIKYEFCNSLSLLRYARPIVIKINYSQFLWL